MTDRGFCFAPAAMLLVHLRMTGDLEITSAREWIDPQAAFQGDQQVLAAPADRHDPSSAQAAHEPGGRR